MTETNDADRVAGHPLAGVPRKVLETVYDALGAWKFTDDMTDNEVCEVGDALAANLNARGYLTWPERLPSRDALLLALDGVAYEYRNSDDESRSFNEWVVDGLVLPLLRSLNHASDGGRHDVDVTDR